MAKVEHWATADGWSGEMEQGPTTKLVRLYWATLESVNTDPMYIFSYKDCPKLGDRHKPNTAALVIRVKVSQVGASKIYKVEVEYSTNASDANNDPNPLKRPAVIDISTRLEEVETFRDGKGRIRINTAGDIQVGTTLKAIQDISIQKNVSTVPDWFHTLPGSVNNSPVEIDGITYDQRTLLLGASERPNRILENKVWYFPIRYDLTHDRDTHDTFEPSTGFHYLEQTPSEDLIKVNKSLGIPSDPIVYTKKRITIGPGDYPSEPQYLDKNGKHIVLEPDKKRGGLDTSSIYIIRRNDFREEDLNVLPRK
jgi:hypothetical protein